MAPAEVGSIFRLRRRPFVLLAFALLTLLVAACSSAEPDAGETGSEDAVASVSTTTATTSTSTSVMTATTADSTAMSSTSSPDSSDQSCPDQQPGSGNLTISVESVSYPVEVFVPSSSDYELLPIVINWHGLGSNGTQQMLLSDYVTLAESEGFLVAHPTGLANTDSGDARGWELAQFDVAGRDDVAMAEALIDRLIEDFCGDPNRVYSTGMSNGGFFTARLVCELSDRLAAAVSVAGTSHYDECRPSRTVPYMAFHGTEDDVVPFAGGESSLASPESPPQLQTFFAQVMPDEFAEFGADFGCTSNPTVTEVSDEVVRYDYQGCDDGAALTFVEVVGGGHTWPGSPLGPVMEGFVGLTTDDISATADGWAFMSQHELSN